MAKAEDFLKDSEAEAKQIILAAISVDKKILDHIWPNFSFDLELRQEILDLIRKEAQYAIESGARPEGAAIPDYRDMFEPRFLKAIGRPSDIAD